MFSQIGEILDANLSETIIPLDHKEWILVLGKLIFAINRSFGDIVSPCGQVKV